MEVPGLSVEEIDRLSDEFVALVEREMVKTANAAARHLGDRLEARADLASVSQGDVNIIFRLWDASVRNVLLAALEDVWLHAANHQVRAVEDTIPLLAAVSMPNASTDPGATAPPPPPQAPNVFVRGAEAAAAALGTATNRLRQIGNEVWANARISLTAGMEAGESIPRLARRVRESVGASRARATMIARTEVIGASNAGSIYAMRSTNGLVTRKSWLATFDTRTRPDHAAANRQTVDLGEKFIVGGNPMDHPGDPNGPAEQVINCRCSMTFEVEMPPPDDPLGFTAAAVSDTTGMIALRPSDPDMFVVDGGDPADELHVTLAFLGSEVDDGIREGASKIAQSISEWDWSDGPIQARVAGYGVLGDDGAVVLLLNGDWLSTVRDNVAMDILDVDGVPEQHTPWLPHMTLGYGLDVSVAEQFIGREFTIDAITVDVGDTHERFELGQGVVTLPAGAGEYQGDVDMAEDMNGSLAKWRGIMVVEGTPTGDGRQFAEGSLTWPDLPMPLQWQKETSHGGMNDVTVTVGTIEAISRDGDALVGEGHIDLGSEDGREVFRRIDELGLGGVSIVADDPENADVELVYPEGCADLDQLTPEEIEQVPLEDLDKCFMPELVIYHSGRVRALTVVDTPAFVEAKIEIVDEAEVTAAVALPVSLTVGDRVFELGQATSVEDVAEFIAAQAVAMAEISTEAFATDETQETEPDDKPLAAGGVGAPAEQNVEAESDVPDRLVAAAYTVTIPDVPPLEWYAEPRELPPIGAIKVTPEGRIYGLLAPKGVAHRGFADQRIEVPMGNVDYSRFMSRSIPVTMADNTVEEIPAGAITMNCGHASTTGTNAEAALAHYDNSCSIVATVRVGENSKGVWVAGALMPGIETQDLARLLACQLSGDWRPHKEQAGMRELTAALLVPVPGFVSAGPSVRLDHGELVAATAPVQFDIGDNDAETEDQQVVPDEAAEAMVDAYKATVIDTGDVETVNEDAEQVTATVLDDLPSFEDFLRDNDPRVQAAQIAEELGLDRQTRLAELVASVKGND